MIRERYNSSNINLIERNENNDFDFEISVWNLVTRHKLIIFNNAGNIIFIFYVKFMNRYYAHAFGIGNYIYLLNESLKKCENLHDIHTQIQGFIISEVCFSAFENTDVIYI